MYSASVFNCRAMVVAAHTGEVDEKDSFIGRGTLE